MIVIGKEIKAPQVYTDDRGRIVTEKTYREFKINEQKTLFDFE